MYCIHMIRVKVFTVKYTILSVILRTRSNFPNFTLLFKVSLSPLPVIYKCIRLSLVHLTLEEVSFLPRAAYL